MSKERIQTRISDAIAVVTLSRPAKRNALDMASFEELAKAGEQLASRDDVRVVILEGSGDHFCAGLDLGVLRNGVPDASLFEAVDDGGANFFQRATEVWRRLPVPVICAIRGVAVGGGLQIAAAADIRVAHPASRFSVLEIRWGLVPDMGLVGNLPSVAPDRLRELTFTGRFFDGREAYELGIVTRLDDDPAVAARGLAADIAARSPAAIRAAKQLLRTADEAVRAERLRLEARLQQALIGGQEHADLVRAAIAGQATGRPE